jgi:subtilase family serine protease
MMSTEGHGQAAAGFGTGLGSFKAAKRGAAAIRSAARRTAKAMYLATAGRRAGGMNLESLERRQMFAAANLQVIGSTITSVTPIRAGEELTVNWTTQNVGDAPTTSYEWYDRVAYSVDDVWGNDDDRTVIDDAYTSGDLAAGQTRTTGNRTFTLPSNAASGAGHLLFKVDVYNYQGESNETDNVRAMQITVAEPGVDFAATPNAQTPSSVTVKLGQKNVSVGFTVTNLGANATKADYWYQGVYVSDDAVFDPDQDQYVAEDYTYGPLDGVGGANSYDADLTFNVPTYLTAGTGKYLLLVANAHQYQPEDTGAGANNVIAVPLTIEQPDWNLTVASASVEDGAPAARPVLTPTGPFSVDYVGQNVGSEAMPWFYWRDSIYFSLDQTLDDGDTLLGTKYNDRQLGAVGTASATYSRTFFDLVIPTGLHVGDGYLIVAVDRFQGSDSPELAAADDAPPAHGVIPETNDADNAFVLPVTIAPYDVDLDITGVTAPASGVMDTHFTATVNGVNLGTTATASGVYFVVYLSADGVTADHHLGSGYLASAGADGTWQVVVDAWLPSASSYVNPDLPWKLLFVADPHQGNGDSNYDNNTFAVDFDLLPPDLDLSVESVTAPTFGIAGQDVSVTWKVKNVGTVTTPFQYWHDVIYLSVDDQLSDDDILLDIRQHYGRIAGGVEYTDTNTWTTIPSNVPTGNYHILVRTNRQSDNAADVMVEDDKTNNVNATPIRIVRPDLKVSAASAPTPDAELGSYFTVNWTVLNKGEAPVTSSWTDRFYLSSDANFDPDSDYELGSSTYFPSPELASGGTANRTASVYISSEARYAGAQYLIVRNGGVGGQDENYADNWMAIPIFVHGGDLKIINPVITPSNAGPGTPTTVTFTVRNDGDREIFRPYYGWRDSVYFSTDAVFDYGDVRGATSGRYDIASLKPGESYDVTLSFTVPSNMGSDFYLLGVVDSDSAAHEAGEDNNVVLFPVSGVVLPDLTVTYVQSAGSGTINDTVTFTWTVKNLGNGPATGDWYDSFFLSTDDQFDGNDVLVGRVLMSDLTPLNAVGQAGDSYTYTYTFTLPRMSAGQYNLIAVTDRYGFSWESNNNLQSETNEGNNTRSIPFTVKAPDLSVTNVTGPTNVGSSQGGVSVSWTVTNLSPDATARAYWYDSFYISTDAFFSVDDVALLVNDPYSFKPLAGGASYTSTRTIDLPALPSGKYYLIAITDHYANYSSASNQQGETDETNNFKAIEINIAAPDLTVPTAGAPVSAVLNQTITVNWTVDNVSANPAPGQWYDTVYLSDDDKLDSTDVFLNAKLRPGGTTPMAGNGTYDASMQVTIPGGKGIGSKYLIFVTDSKYWYDDNFTRQGEDNETNNARAVPIELVTTNLVPTLPVVTPGGLNPVAGEGAPRQPFTFSWTVTNTGTTPAPGTWYDRVYLSKNGSYSSDDVLVGTFDASSKSGLGAGASYVVTITGELPDVAPGQWQLLLVTDVGNGQSEVNENDNAIAIPFTIKAPNLVVQNLAVTPTSPKSGGTVTVTYDVANSGVGTAYGDSVNGWYDRVSIVNLDTNQVLRTVTVGHGTDGPLAAGASRQKFVLIDLPHGPTAVGRLEVRVVADYDGYSLGYGSVYEYTAAGARANADNAQTAEVTSTLGAYPDLTVTTPSIAGVSGPLTSGQKAVIRWTLTNGGDGVAAGYWRDRVTVKNLATGETFYDELVPFYGGSVAANGGTAAREITIDLPHGARGTGTLVVTITADADNFVLEATPTGNAEQNNVGTAQAASALAKYPDLRVTAVTLPATAQSGNMVAVTWTITNHGDGDATGTWVDQVFLSGNNSVGNDGNPYGSFTYTGTIPANGGSITRTQLIQLPFDLEGTFYAVVKTDAYDTLRDYPDDNNTNISLAPMLVTLRDFPNLVVAKVTVPPKAFSGQKALIKWQVQNTGQGATAGTWLDSVYLSTNNEFDSLDVLLGRVGNMAALQSGEIYENEIEFSLPRGISGTWYVIVRTDTGSTQTEPLHEGDNQRISAGMDVTLTAPPDLQVIGHSFGSAFLFSGQTLPVTWTVKNVGEGPSITTAWDDAVYFSDDAELDADDLRLTTFGRNQALGSLGQYNAGGTITLPIGISGKKYILFRTDYKNEVFESAFDNNNVRAVEVDINLTPPPDLEVTQLQTLTPVLTGRKFKVQYEVTNNGLTTVPNSTFKDQFFLSRDGTLDLNEYGQPINGDVLLLDRTRGGALTPGGFTLEDVDLQFSPFTQTGNYYLIVLTDAGKAVFESDDANNARVLPVTVGADRPNLKATQVLAPAVGVINSSIPVQITLRNDGDGPTYDNFAYEISIWLSADGELGVGDQVLRGTVRGVSLQPGQEITVTGTVQTENLFLSAGNYQLYALVDHFGDQPETNELDNRSAGRPIAMVVRQPNLTLSNPDGPTSVDADAPLTIRWKTANNGNANIVGSFNSTVYLSRDTVLNKQNDIRLNPSTAEGALAIGDVRDVVAKLNLPIDASGNYYLIIVGDSGDSIAESNESDNTLYLPIHVNAYVAPDLRVSYVTAPSEAYSGRPISLVWSVVNAGGPIKTRFDGTMPSWYETVYISADANFDPTLDRALGNAHRIGTMGGGGSYTGGGTFEVPADWSGPSWIFVVVDSTGSVYEGAEGSPNESNNVNLDPGSVMVTATPPTDLVAQPFTIPASGMLGREVTITFTVKNAGDRPALGAWYDSLYLSADGTWDIGDPLISRVYHTGNINPEGSYTVTVTATLPGVLPGDYNVIVRSDILNHVPEGDPGEFNNITASVTKIVADAEVLPLNGSASSKFGQGIASYFKLNVPAGTAGETIRLFLNAMTAQGANELYVAYGRMPSRVDFDARNIEAADVDVSATIPFAKAGSYYVLAYGQGLPMMNGQPVLIDFDLAAQVIPFGVTSVDAVELGNTGPTTVRLRGARFDGSTTFALVGPAGLVLPATGVRFDDAALAYATFDLTNLPSGKYSVRATDSRGVVSTLADAVNVTDGFGGRHAVSFESPNNVRGTFPILVSWGNDGGSDLFAPLIIVTNDLGLNMGFAPNRLGGAGTLSFFGASHDGPAGILRAGEAYSLSLFSTSLPGNVAKYRTYAVRVDDPRALDLDYLRSQLPDNVLNDPNFPALWDGIRAAVGPTWGSYVRTLAQLANQVTDRLGNPHQPMTMLGLLADKVRASLGSSITGTALSADLGVPVANRLVTARNLVTGEQFATYTLADGQFIFTTATPGSYTFKVEGAVLAGATAAEVLDGTPLTNVGLTLAAGARVAGSARGASGAILANATITLTSGSNSYATLTDGNGNYVIEGILPGLYTLIAQADGFARARVDALDVQTAAISNNFTLAAESRFTGNLASSPAGDPLATFTVTAVRRNAGTASNPDVYTLSAPAGAFTLDGLPAGTYDVTVRRTGYGSQSVVMTLGDAQDLFLGTFDLYSGGKITGSVASEIPAVGRVGLSVAAFNAAGQRVATALLRTDGTFALPDIAAGTYTLRIEGMTQGFSTTQTVTVAGAETVAGVALRLVPGASITGNLGGPSTAGLTVVATTPDGRIFTGVAGADGTYRITGLEPGTYSVGVPGATAFPTVQVNSLSEDTYTVDFSLAVSSQIGGLVLTAGGQPIAGARVILLVNGNPVTSTETNDDGAYTFVLWQPGTYTVQVEALDASFSEAAVTVAAGQQATQVFHAGSAVARVTVQGPTVVGSTVRLYQLLANGARRLAGQATLGPASDGFAQFGRLTPGTYVAEVTGPNNTGGSVTFTVSTGSTAQATVTLANLGKVTGTVTSGTAPVASARVLLLDAVTRKVVAVAMTDAQGNYALPNVANGSYELVVLLAGHTPSVTTLTVSDAGQVAQDATLVAGGPTLTGRVVDANGNPVAGGGVTVLDADGRPVGYATANPDGTFAVVGALGGVAVQVAAPGGPSAQTALAAGPLATGTTAAGDVVAQVLAAAKVTPAAAAAAESFAKVQALMDALDFEMPQWLQVMIDNLSAGYDRDPNEATFGMLIPITADCIDECGELLAAAVREINLQDMQYERVVGFQEGVSLLAKTALASMIAEPFYVLGSLAAAALAIKGLIVAAGWGFAVEGSAALLYSIAQIGSNIYTIVDSLQQAIRATTPQDSIGALEYASNLMSNTFGLLTGATELAFTAAGKTPAPALGNFLGGTGNIFNLVGFVASLRGIWAAANFETTIGILTELIDANATLDKVKDAYKGQIAKAHAAVEAYNRCMEACEREEDDDNGNPPGTPDGPGDDEDDVTMPVSRDPNDILGPAGYGDQNWTAAPVGKSLGYTIRFENAADATAPAQVVTVTQQLDSDLDWRTFRIDGFGFGDVSINLPGDRGFHVQRLDLREVFGVYVDFSATVDPASGTLTFRFVAIDPATGDVPTDPTVGFLPPEDGEGIGQGYVRYSVKPKSTAATGTVIDALASIVFDDNAAIDTPPISNTLDRRAPGSAVVALPPNSSGVIRVKWSGTDDEQAGDEQIPTSGLTRFDVYVRVDNGQWTLWLEDTDLLESDYLASAGHTYMFYSVAKDLAGNVESAPVLADAVTHVASPNSTPVLDLPTSPVTVNEGSIFSQTGSFADPDLDDAWTATVNYGDGSGDLALSLNPDGTFNLSHGYADDGDYVVTVKVTDSKGAFATKTIGVHADNVAPTLDVIPDATLPYGTAFSASAHFVDAGTADTHTATVNYGDGSGDLPLEIGPGGTFTLSRAFASPGTYTVTVSVTDDNGGVATQTLTVKVLAPAPVLAQPVKVNNGAAQRSVVKSLTLTFDRAVNFDPAAFVLTRRDGSVVPMTITASDDRKTLTLTFASLADGIYDLAVAATGVWNDDGVKVGQNLSYTFHRLFGDRDGDKDVDSVDSAWFRSAMGKVEGQAGFAAEFDRDGNGVVDSTDSAWFRANLGSKFLY